MPAGSEKLAFGRYTATFDAVSIGITQGGPNGIPTIHSITHGIAIDSTDRYGSSIIDGIFRGYNFHLAMVLKEWSVVQQGMLYPFHATWGLLGAIGSDFFSVAGELVMTAVVATPAFTHGPSTLTASKCIIPPNHRTQHSMGPIERDSPTILQMLPYDTGAGVIGWFTWT